MNLNGMFYCLKQAVPRMKEQGSGCIINIATESVRTALPLRTPYVASKAGVMGLTHTVAREVGPFGIRCNAILPGAVDNPRGRRLVEAYGRDRGLSAEEAERDFLQYISMRCWIDPTEIGEVAVFLASHAGRHISGQYLGVSGHVEWESS